MKIILSPTKKMKTDRDSLAPGSLPCFLYKTREIRSALQKMSFLQLQALWGCNDSIARQNADRLSSMDLESHLTPAILSYEGLAFQYMAPSVFSDRQLQYVQEHLRILSGFYGVLKPLVGITPYRLEMQAPLSLGPCRDLYAFWGDLLYKEVRDHSGIFINLASREYSQCITKYLRPEDQMITCTFGELNGSKVRQKATLAKMARGEMVRFLAEREAEDPEEMKNFHRLNFVFHPELSSASDYVFIRRLS